jgi:hypothetical protein
LSWLDQLREALEIASKLKRLRQIAYLEIALPAKHFSVPYKQQKPPAKIHTTLKAGLPFSKPAFVLAALHKIGSCLIQDSQPSVLNQDFLLEISHLPLLFERYLGAPASYAYVLRVFSYLKNLSA